MEFAALPPGIELGTQGIDGAALVVQVAVDRHSLLPLPALDGRHVPAQVRGNLLPGIKAMLGRGLGQRFVEEGFAHSPPWERSGDSRPDCNAPDENCKTRHLAANGSFRLSLFA